MSNMSSERTKLGSGKRGKCNGWVACLLGNLLVACTGFIGVLFTPAFKCGRRWERGSKLQEEGECWWSERRRTCGKERAEVKE